MSATEIRPAIRRAAIEGLEMPGWLLKHKRARRIIRAALACPPWVSRKELKQLDAEAKRRTLATGIPHQVGHLIPVDHPMVCGLTVPWNLRVMTKAENARMSHLALQGDLFEDPEQLLLI